MEPDSQGSPQLTNLCVTLYIHHVVVCVDCNSGGFRRLLDRVTCLENSVKFLELMVY